MKRAARWWPALIVLVAIAWQFRAPLSGRVYWFEDIAAYFQPLYLAAARQMRFGMLPSWALGAWSGQPLLGDPQLGALYPPNWLWMMVAPVRLYAWLQLAHALFGAAGMWMLARARGRSRPAAAVAALALGLGAFVVLETRHAMFIATTAWLPWVLWAIERYAGERKLEHLAMAAAATALALLGGGWSMLYFGGAVIAGIALAHLLRAGRPPRARVRLAVALLLAGLLGLALSAAQLGPALAHARLSPRAIGVDYTFASSYAWPSWRYLVTLLFPTWYGDVARNTYIGASDQWELCGYSIGVTASILALLSLLDRRRRGERLALFGLCLIALDLARGAGGALHPIFFRHLPLYGALRCPARALYVWVLIGPILAADGLDALAAKIRWPRARTMLAFALVLGVAGELTFTFRSENPSTTLSAARARPEAARWLWQNGRPGRFVDEPHLGQRFHNAGLAWGLDSAGGYSSLPIWRYLHFLYIANHGRVYPHAKLADDLTAQGLWRYSSPLVDLLGVRWVLAPRDRPIRAPGFSRAFAGKDDIDVWKNDEAYPSAFVVYRARAPGDDAAQAQAIAAADFRPHEVAILDRPLASVPAPSAGEMLPPPTALSALAREGPLDLAIGIEARAPGVLVMNEPWYPGWRVTVDGRPATLLRVDYALRGVALSPGRHIVALTYFNAPLAYGGAVSLLALALLCALVLVARRRRLSGGRGL
ncbi:MAG TPA: hypothetical protein VII38_17895 [Polyangia bacterium]